MQTTPELDQQGEHGIETAAPHPEEMKASVHLQLGNLISLQVTARATPAGVFSVALLLAALVGASAWVSRSRP